MHEASEGMLSATLTRVADACQRRTAQWPGHLCMSTLAMLSCKSDTCAVHVRYRQIFREIYTEIILRDPYHLTGAAWTIRASRGPSGGSRLVYRYAYADYRLAGCQALEGPDRIKITAPWTSQRPSYDVIHVACSLVSQSPAESAHRNATDSYRDRFYQK